MQLDYGEVFSGLDRIKQANAAEQNRGDQTSAEIPHLAEEKDSLRNI